MCGPAPSGVTNGTERNEDGLHVKVPDAVDPREAALFGMASVAMRSCRNADLRMGDRLLIVGAGFVGQAAAQSPPWWAPALRCATSTGGGWRQPVGSAPRRR
jgi:hypothetical protein